MAFGKGHQIEDVIALATNDTDFGHVPADQAEA
jgi:hypothetical protein